MKYLDWDKIKNQKLISERNISFEDVKIAVNEKKVLDDFDHPNQKRYPGQRIMAVEIDNYVFLVPYIPEDGKIFLKTIIPSRKATKKYLGGNK